MARPRALLPVLFFFSLPLWRTSAAPVLVVCDEDYPPYAFRDEKGALVGIVPDQWAEWSKVTGEPVRLMGMPWSEALEAFASGRADVLDTVFETPERDRLYDFTPPYAAIEVPVFIHSSISGIRSAEDLKSFRVAVKNGDAAIGQLEKLGAVYLEGYPDYASIAKAAKLLDVRIFCVDKPPALYYLYKLGIDRDYRIAFYLKGNSFRRAVRKGSTELLGRVDRGFAAVPLSAYERIEREWLGVSLAPHIDFGLFGAIFGTLAALVLALAGIAWILRMRVASATAELREKVDLLERSEAKNRAFIAALPDLCFIMDRDCRYLDYVASDPGLLAFPPEDFLGKTMGELGFPGDVIEAVEAGIASVLDAGRMADTQYSLRIGGEMKDFECRIVPLSGNEVIAISRDVTASRKQSAMLARSLAEKEVLLKEIHHRVKNNLQLISSLLAIQATAEGPGEGRKLLAEAQQRIHSFARLHELAYASPDLASIDLVEYVESLARGISTGFGTDAIGIEGPRGLRVPVGEAVPLGLIANELITNALKYGEGRISVSLSRREDELRLAVEDEGPGLPSEVDPSTTSSMGFFLIRSLADQLGGRLSFSGPPGLRATLSFPFPEEDGESVP